MARWVRQSFYVLFGLSVVGYLFGEAPQPTDGDKSTDVFDADYSMSVALPNDPDKVRDFATVPQQVALPTSPAPTRPRVARPDRRQEPVVQTPTEYVFVTGSRVNLRAGPSTNNRRIGAFDRGTKLIVRDRNQSWAKVTGSIAGTPITGWMSRAYLSDAPPAVQTAAPAPRPKRQITTASSADIAAARRAIIQQSIANYSGSCPCDYNRDRSGRRCGKRSAWSRPGGASPICYDSDVTRSHLTAYFRRLGRQYP